MKLYVGNLNYDTTQDTLQAAFSAHGQVEEVAVITDRETGRPRGFAFVTMEDEGGKTAIETLNGAELDGRTLVVNEAQPREPRQGGGGGGGYGGRGGGGGGGGGGPRRGGGGGGRGGGGGGGGGRERRDRW